MGRRERRGAVMASLEKHRELRAAQPLALNQKEEKNFEKVAWPICDPTRFAAALTALRAGMTLARHEPCQLLKRILAQGGRRCWTQTLRLPYGESDAR
jgi:hypothetical protein